MRKTPANQSLWKSSHRHGMSPHHLNIRGSPHCAHACELPQNLATPNTELMRRTPAPEVSGIANVKKSWKWRSSPVRPGRLPEVSSLLFCCFFPSFFLPYIFLWEIFSRTVTQGAYISLLKIGGGSCTPRSDHHILFSRSSLSLGPTHLLLSRGVLFLSLSLFPPPSLGSLGTIWPDDGMPFSPTSCMPADHPRRPVYPILTL